MSSSSQLPSATQPAASFDPETLRPAITRILQQANHAQVSTKMVRNELLIFYPALDMSTKERRTAIDAITKEIFASLPPSPSPSPPPASSSSSVRKSHGFNKMPKKEPSTDTSTRTAYNTGYNKLMHLSPALSDVVGETTMSRPQVTKNLWIYIKANSLQDPNDRRVILCDAKLRKVFGKQIGMFQMAKKLSDHLSNVE